MSRKTTDYIIIHCTATRPSQDIGFEEVNNWHRARGWIGCGYHFIIKRDGKIEDGRTTDAVNTIMDVPSRKQPRKMYNIVRIAKSESCDN